MTATALWTAIKSSYVTADLISLTNLRDRAATAIDDTYGEDACQDVIDMWPLHTQEEYSGSDSAHVVVAKQVVIALLWRRGGSSVGAEKVKWEEAVELMRLVKNTGPRARRGPKTNSGVRQKTERVNGRSIHGWSDRGSYPIGHLPQSRPRSGGDNESI